MKLHSKLAGYYKIEKVMHAGTKEECKVPLTDWFPNLILDTGLDRVGYVDGFVEWGVTFHYTGFCRLGSGNTAPQVTDLDLVSSLGYSSTRIAYTQGNSSSPLYYKFATITYRFNVGVATGNISEVGVGWGTTAGTLFSRALILDSGGLPTTITKLADEVLDITYQFRIYPSLIDFTGGFTLTGSKGAAYTYTGRIASVGALMSSYGTLPYPIVYVGISVSGYTGALGAITTIPLGANGAGTTVMDAYTTGSHRITGVSTFGLDTGNDALGIRSVVIKGQQASWQFEFNTPILKTVWDTLSFNVEISWGRA